MEIDNIFIPARRKNKTVKVLDIPSSICLFLKLPFAISNSSYTFEKNNKENTTPVKQKLNNKIDNTIFIMLFNFLLHMAILSIIEYNHLLLHQILDTLNLKLILKMLNLYSLRQNK